MNLWIRIGIVLLVLFAGGGLLARDWHGTDGKLLLSGELKGSYGPGDAHLSVIQRADGVVIYVFKRYLAENERQAAAQVFPDWLPAQRKWGDPMLDRLVPEDLPEMPLTEAAARWSQWCAKTVFIDARALKAAGLAADVRVSGATRGLPACEAMDRVLEPRGLTWFEREGYCYITTPKRAKTFWIIDVYAPFGYGDSTRLANEIVRDVAPASWKVDGGEGQLLTMSDGALVICQTADVQRQIRERYFQRMAPTRLWGTLGGVPEIRTSLRKLETPPLMTFDEFVRWAKAVPGIAVELDDEAIRVLTRDNAGLRVPGPVPPVKSRHDLIDVYLRHYCEQFGLQWEFDQKGGKVLPTGARQMYTRYYRIDELGPYVKSPSEAVIELYDAFQALVVPHSWHRGSGEGEMVPDEFGGWLCVRQTTDVHARLSTFIAQLSGAAGEPRNEASRIWRTKDGRLAGEAAVRRARAFPTIVQRPNGEYDELRFTVTDADREHLEPRPSWDQWGRFGTRLVLGGNRWEGLAAVAKRPLDNVWPAFADLNVIGQKGDDSQRSKDVLIERGLPPVVALDRALRDRRLTWYLRLGVICVTTEEAVRKAREPVVYRVLQEGKQGDLVEQIKRDIAAGTWDAAHDAAIARYGRNVLIVRHSPLVQQELRQKLWRKLVPIHCGPPKAPTLPTTEIERRLLNEVLNSGAAESVRGILRSDLGAAEPTGRVSGFRLDVASLPEASLRSEKAWPDGPSCARTGTNLLMALEQIGLAWTEDGEDIVFTTRAVAEKKLYKRSYPLQGLTGEGCDGKDLLPVLQTTLSPKTWKAAGGQGTVEVSADGQSLEVVQNSLTHWELFHLFERLRTALDICNSPRGAKP